MTHVTHPYSYRLGYTYSWKNRWFDERNYRRYLKADTLIRERMEKKLRNFGVSSIEIERAKNLFSIVIKTSKPGLLIGRKGEGIEKLRNEIARLHKKITPDLLPEIKISIEEVRSPLGEAKIVAENIAQDLEKRLPYRRVLKRALVKAMGNRENKGVKILLKGRLGGADIARREGLMEGRMPLQTLTADIDFARERAYLPYGDIGIKVWIYRGPVKKV